MTNKYIAFISALFLSTSHIALASEATLGDNDRLDPTQSVQTSALESTEIDFTDLEARFPTFFGGFGRADFDLAESWRTGNEESNAMRADARIGGKIQELHDAIQRKADSRLEQVQSAAAEILSTPALHTPYYYVALLGYTALMLSEPNEEEAQIFRANSFSRPYSFIMEMDKTAPFTESLIRFSESTHHSATGDFGESYSSTRYTFDFLKLRDLFNSYTRTETAYVLCENAGEDIFGLYFLAMAYYRGLHPVPVSLADSEDELHGFVMSQWGKMCHDLAHSKANRDNMNVMQFALNIFEGYLRTFEGKILELPLVQRGAVSVNVLEKPVVKFAVTVHQAYRRSLVNIMTASLDHMGVSESATELPEDFQAFAAGAFIHAHENQGSENLSHKYATDKLADLLQETTRVPLAEVDSKAQAALPKEEDSGDSAAAAAATGSGAESAAASVVEPEHEPDASATATGTETDSLTDSFKTSIIDGSSPLSDEEILAIVVEKPLGSFVTSRWAVGMPTLKVNADKITKVNVIRSRYSIEVHIFEVSGQHHVYRENSRYFHSMNLQHDLSLLKPAAAILASEYEYIIPTAIPTLDDFEGDEKQYSDAVEAFRHNLLQGKKHVLNYFMKTAMDIAETRGIADAYAAQYTVARDELATHMPSFVGDLQTALESWMPVSASAVTAKTDEPAAVAEESATDPDVSGVSPEESVEEDGAPSSSGDADSADVAVEVYKEDT